MNLSNKEDNVCIYPPLTVSVKKGNQSRNEREREKDALCSVLNGLTVVSGVVSEEKCECGSIVSENILSFFFFSPILCQCHFSLSS